MRYLHDALHAQLHGSCANDDLDGGSGRKRLSGLHVAASGTDVSKSATIRNVVSLAKNIGAQAASVARLNAAIGR